MEKPNFAYIRLARVGGCNFKMPVTYKGKSVYVNDPQVGKTYRLSAEKFINGINQIRDASWVISPWNDAAERRTESERNWMA